MSRVLEHSYTPRGSCKAIMEDRTSEVLISGPAGTGKSRACLEKILMVCLLNPNTRALIVRKTLASLGSTALVTWRKYVAREALAVGDIVYYGGSAQEAPQYRFSNGSTVTVGGMNHPERIMSSEYDIVYVQEATELTLEDIDFINTRLRNWTITFQQLLMDCNPASDVHPLKLRCNEGKTKLYESRHEDNPVLFDDDGNLTEKGKDYIEGKLDKLTGVRYKRLRLGLWVSAEGQIYEEFDPAYHILPWSYDAEGNKLPLPSEWERYWVIDFGLVHPFVCKWYAEDDDGALYMYRELYMTQKTVEEHCQTIRDQVMKRKVIKWYDHFNQVERERIEFEWIEPTPTAIICDWDAEGRRTIERHLGMGTQAANKDVSTGIDLTKQRWKLDEDGNARLYYMEDSLVERDQLLVDDLKPTCSAEEIPSYVFKKTNDGKVKDEPVKENDHGMDTDRYMVMHRDHKGSARFTQLD